jgi:hypothetical protein
MLGLDVPANDHAYLDECLDELEASGGLSERLYSRTSSASVTVVRGRCLLRFKEAERLNV